MHETLWAVLRKRVFLPGVHGSFSKLLYDPFLDRGHYAPEAARKLDSRGVESSVCVACLNSLRAFAEGVGEGVQSASSSLPDPPL